MVKNQACIGTFIIFTAKKLHWVVNEKEESWTGQYFRDVIRMQHVFPFLKQEENVIDLNQVTFVHDKAPGMRSNMTQHLLKDNDITFSDNSIQPGNSPDLNVAEHIGAKIKDEVERKRLLETVQDRHKQETVERQLVDVLTNMESNVELFENLLCSYPSRLQAVRNTNGRHTDY